MWPRPPSGSPPSIPKPPRPPPPRMEAARADSMPPYAPPSAGGDRVAGKCSIGPTIAEARPARLLPPAGTQRHADCTQRQGTAASTQHHASRPPAAAAPPPPPPRRDPRAQGAASLASSSVRLLSQVAMRCLRASRSPSLSCEASKQMPRGAQLTCHAWAGSKAEDGGCSGAPSDHCARHPLLTSPAPCADSDTSMSIMRSMSWFRSGAASPAFLQQQGGTSQAAHIC